jgi:hypothetical protein
MMRGFSFLWRAFRGRNAHLLERRCPFRFLDDLPGVNPQQEVRALTKPAVGLLLFHQCSHALAYEGDSLPQ